MHAYLCTQRSCVRLGVCFFSHSNGSISILSLFYTVLLCHIRFGSDFLPLCIATHNFFGHFSLLLLFILYKCICAFLSFSHTRSPFAMFVYNMLRAVILFFFFISHSLWFLSLCCALQYSIGVWESMQPWSFPMITYVVYEYLLHVHEYLLYRCCWFRCFFLWFGIVCSTFSIPPQNILCASVALLTAGLLESPCAKRIYLILFHCTNTRTYWMLDPYNLIKSNKQALSLESLKYELSHLINCCIRNAAQNKFDLQLNCLSRVINSICRTFLSNCQSNGFIFFGVIGLSFQRFID